MTISQLLLHGFLQQKLPEEVYRPLSYCLIQFLECHHQLIEWLADAV
jgi:hypothetical protein